MLKSDWLEAWHRALVIKHSRGQQPSPHTGTMAAAVTAAAEAAAAAARGLHPPHHLGAVVRPLDRARPMQVFRRRHADERGVVTWEEEDEQGGVVLHGPAEEQLRSLISSRDAYVRFVNGTPHNVRLLWLNYRGEEVAYDELAPGAMLLQHTFVTHPWLVREAETATQLLLDGRPVFVVAAPTPAQEEAAAEMAAAAEAEPAGAAHALAHAAAPAGAQAQDSAPAPPQAQQPAAVPVPAAQQQHQQPSLSPQQRRQLALARNAADALVISLEDALLIPTVTVTSLPQLAWSVESHRFFPAPFKASVRALLLSYQRLHRQRQLQQAAALRLRACRASSSSSGAASRAHLGDIPFELLPVIAGMAAPFAPQGVHLDGPGSAGILPTLLPADWRTLAWGPLPMQGSIGGGA